MHISNKCSIAIHCLIFIYEYGKENKVTSELLSLSTGCNPVIIRSIMSALKKDGMISVKSGTGGTQLICPPEEITLYRISSCIEPDTLNKLIGIHQHSSRLCPVGKNIKTVLSRSYDKICMDLKKSMESVTLKEILVDYHERTIY